MFRNTSLFIKNFLICFYLKPNIWMEYAKARPYIWVFFTYRQNTDHLETIAVSLFTLGLRFSYFKFNKHLFRTNHVPRNVWVYGQGWPGGGWGGQPDNMVAVRILPVSHFRYGLMSEQSPLGHCYHWLFKNVH